MNANVNHAPSLADLHADPMFRSVQRLGIAGLGALFEQDRINAGGIVSKDESALPACDGFVGTGTRCTSCKIRKSIHN